MCVRGGRVGSRGRKGFVGWGGSDSGDCEVAKNNGREFQ